MPVVAHAGKRCDGRPVQGKLVLTRSPVPDKLRMSATSLQIIPRGELVAPRRPSVREFNVHMTPASWLVQRELLDGDGERSVHVSLDRLHRLAVQAITQLAISGHALDDD